MSIYHDQQKITVVNVKLIIIIIIAHTNKGATMRKRKIENIYII